MKVYKCYFKYTPEYEYLGGYSFDDFQEMIILADSKEEAKEIFVELIKDCMVSMGTDMTYILN